MRVSDIRQTQRVVQRIAAKELVDRVFYNNLGFSWGSHLTNPLQASAQARFLLLRVFDWGWYCQQSWRTMGLCLLVR